MRPTTSNGYLFKLPILFVVFGACVILGACGSSSQTTASDINQPEVIDHVNTVDSISEMAVGDLFYLTFSEGATAMDFTGAPSPARYILALQSASTSGSSYSAFMGALSHPFKDDLGMKSFLDRPADAQGFMDSWMRYEEEASALSGDYKESIDASTSKGTYGMKASVGDTTSLKVLTSIGNTSLCDTITAQVKCVTDRLILYNDARNPSGTFETEDFDTLCAQFDRSMQAEYALYGEPSDINGDGHVSILLSKGVNLFGRSGGGIVTGYFWAGDMGSSVCSNHQEIVYALIPDPTKEFSTYPIPKAFAMSNYLPAVVPHEVQHAINYNYHVIVNHVSSEESWLNEAMSHLSEDLVGYGMENPSRVSDFLDATEDVSLLNNTDLEGRGASYLFLRYLYEQATDGNAFVRSLVQSDKRGIANVEAAFAGTEIDFNQFEEYMIRWAIAVLLTDAGVTSDTRYVYDSRTWNGTTKHWQGACLRCDTEDGRSTILGGPMIYSYSSGGTIGVVGGAEVYIDIENPPTSIPVTMSTSGYPQAVLIRVE